MLDSQQRAGIGPGQGYGDGVEREVPAGEIRMKPAGLDFGQRSWSGIGLGAPLSDVDPACIPFHTGRAEALESDDPRRIGLGQG